MCSIFHLLRNRTSVCFAVLKDRLYNGLPLLAIILAVPAIDASGQDTSASAVSSATITVHADQSLGPVNPLIFGNNIEAANTQGIFGSEAGHPGVTGAGVWNPRKAVPVPEVLAAMEAVGVKILRYPGGCLTHNFDWKEAIGPANERPYFAFGLNEFLQLCRDVGAKPLITVSAYVGTPQDSADLVEYLNAPADEAHPWAQRRAADGWPEPWGVVYFEMGNESDHGNHDIVPFKRWTAEGYANWFNQCAAGMKSVDPSIQMGALTGTGTGPNDPWNRIVAKKVADTADFITVHTYAVEMSSDSNKVPADLLMRACMASTDQFAEDLAEYRRILYESAGRKFPLAITEYNALFVNSHPVPYRFSLGAALFSADYLRVLLQPENDVLMAQYWQFINGYWGLLRGPYNVSDLPPEQRHYQRMPAYFTLRLWGQHFGTELLTVRVDSPTLDFEGFNKILPRRAPAAMDAPLPVVKLRAGDLSSVRWESGAPDALHLRLDGYHGESYPAFARVAVEGATAYRLSFRAKFTGESQGLQLGLGLVDGRGWEATSSAIAVSGLADAKSWTSFEGTLTTLPDCRELQMIWRLQQKGKTPVIAEAEIEDIRLEPLPVRPAYAAVTSAASLSSDARTLYLIVFNKDADNPQPVEITWPGLRASEARIWTVTGPGFEATNIEQALVSETVSGKRIPCYPERMEIVLPPRSMNALEIKLE